MAHGPAVILAVLVAVTLGYALAAGTTGLAFLATTIRWGSGWLVALTGAQGALGAAVLVGPAVAAASSWLAAASLVVAVPDRSVVTAAGAGTAAALLLAGPGGVDGVAVRGLAIAVTVAATVLIGRTGHARPRSLAAFVLAAGAVALAIAG